MMGEPRDKLSATHDTPNPGTACSLEFLGMDMRTEGNRSRELLRTRAVGKGLWIAEGSRQIQTNNTAVRTRTLFDCGCDGIDGDEPKAGCFCRSIDGADQHQIRRTEHDEWK